MQVHPSGTRIAGRYEVVQPPDPERHILAGGMGLVYLCIDREHDLPVALKTFKPEFLPDRAARERFLEEGNTWVRLGKHPHIVRCYGVERIGDGREVYLVLELVAKEQGRRDASLRAWLTRGQPLPADQALLIALQIARGMGHATEIVHRDLKPANVLVGADRLSNAPCQRVRVTDFGLVRTLRGDGEQQPEVLPTEVTKGVSRLTRIGSIIGTPQYMAPEQWEHGDVTPAADIYALGCILGEMLVGRMLVQGETLDALRRAHEGGQALASVGDTPDAARDVLAHCLATKPGQRYGSWAAVEAALAAAYAGEPGRSAPEAEAAGTLDRAERVAAGWSYIEIGTSYMDLGKAEAALGYFEHTREAGQAEGERRLEAAGIGALGVAHAQLGDTRRAIRYYEQALTLSRQIGDRSGEGNDLGNLGLAYRHLGDARRAIGFHEQALAIHREIGDSRGEANQLGNLGLSYRHVGDPRRAIGFHEQALLIHREIGDRHGESANLGNLGSAYLQLGEARRAIGCYEQAVVIHREIGDRRGEGIGLGSLGTAHHQLGDLRRAIAYYEQALAIRRETGDVHGAAQDCFNMAVLHDEQGDQTQALSLAREAAGLFTQMGNSAYARAAQQLVAQLQAGRDPGVGQP